MPSLVGCSKSPAGTECRSQINTTLPPNIARSSESPSQPLLQPNPDLFQRFFQSILGFQAGLAGKIGCQVLNVFLAQGRGHASHDGILANTGLIFIQGFFDITGILPGQFWKSRSRTIAIGTMAGGADFSRF